jgi:hypothetical protein
VRTSWKAAVVPAAIILLLLFSIAGPIIIAAQASDARLLANETGPFILKATHIDTTNAQLQTLPDITHPIFKFATATIQGLQILAPGPTGYTLKITASSTSRATNVAIKTAIGYELETALASFDNKADLLILALGGTVPQLSMTNVSLTIDTYLKNGTLTLGHPMITLVPGSLNHPAASTESLTQAVASIRATLTPTALATTTATVTATATSTAPTIPGVSVTPTAEATTKSSSSSSTKSSATPTARATASTSSSSSSATSSSSSSSTSSSSSSSSSCNFFCKLKKAF